MNDSQIIAQPGGQQLNLTRESYVHLCDGDFCAARLLNALERWHAYKLTQRKEGKGINRMLAQGGLDPSHDEALWVRMAVESKDDKSLGWRGELMNEYGYKIVSRALDLLLEKGYVQRRENPRQNWDRTPQWLFMAGNVQADVDAWGRTSRDPSTLSRNPDGLFEQGGHSVNPTDCTRPNDRVETADRPSQVGQTTEAITQESFPGFLNRGGVQGSAELADLPSAPLSAPVIEPDSAAHSSSTDSAAPSTSKHEAGPLEMIVGAALASVAVTSQVEASQPDGTADAVGQGTLSDSQDLAKPRGGMNEQATSIEDIPGGGAAAGVEGPSGAGNGAGRAGVDSVRPVDAQVLAARPVAPLNGPAYQALKALLGNGLTSMCKEFTRTGQISRELWLHLEEGEIGLVRKLAQEEAKLTGANMITLAVRGLDRLIGAVKAEAKPSSKKSAAAPAVTGPQDLSHLDPQLVTGQRCSAFGSLGMVESVTNLGYVVLRDDGERVTVDRHLATHLQKLRASDAPAAVSTPAPESLTLFVPAGTSWRRVAGKGGQPGEIVTVQAVLGNARKLSNGTNLPFYTIQRDFEQVSA